MKRICLLILILLLAAAEISAQSLVIRTKDGSEITLPLSSLQKCTFADQNFRATLTNGSASIWNLSDITKIQFSPGSSGTGNTGWDENSGKLMAYPNPANDLIRIKNAPAGMQTIRIFQTDGIQVLQTMISPDQSAVDIHSLARGMYLLKINNQAFTFIKL